MNNFKTPVKVLKEKFKNTGDNNKLLIAKRGKKSKSAVILGLKEPGYEK